MNFFKISETDKTIAIQKLKNIGIDALGIIPASATLTYGKYREIVDNGVPPQLEYLRRNAECRAGFESLMPGTKSIVCCAIAMPRLAETAPCKFARFCALGNYHDVFRDALGQLDGMLRDLYPIQNSRICVDSAPILERELAVRAGLGSIGFNHMVIHPELGSFIALGELLLDVDLSGETWLNYRTGPFNAQSLVPGAHGCCDPSKRRCVAACPTHALTANGYDYHRCIAYWTTQHKGEIPEEFASAMGDVLWGCDRCQNACPRSGKYVGASRPSPLETLEIVEILTLSGKALRKRLENSPLFDAAPNMVQRNAAIVAGNTHDTRYRDILESVAQNHACDWVRATAVRSL